MQGKTKKGARGNGKRRKVGDAGKIKSGVSREARRELLSLAREADARHIKSARRDADALGRRLNRHFRTEHIAIQALLQRQRGFAALQTEALALKKGLGRKLEAAAKEPKKAQRAVGAYSKALRELMEANESIIERAYRSAIDETRMNEKLLSLLPVTEGFVMKRGKFGSVVMRAFHHEDDDGTLNPTGRAADPPLPAVFTAPYDDGADHKEMSLMAAARAFANEETGNLDCHASAFEAGGAAARSLVVSFVELPSGHTVLKVNARIVCDYIVSSLSLAAASFGSTDAIVEVIDTDNTVRTAVTPVDWVLAPVGWSQRHEGDDPYFVDTTFAIPTTGGQFMIRAGVRCNAWAGGLISDGSGTNRGHVDEINVDVV